MMIALMICGLAACRQAPELNIDRTPSVTPIATANFSPTLPPDGLDSASPTRFYPPPDSLAPLPYPSPLPYLPPGSVPLPNPQGNSTLQPGSNPTGILASQVVPAKIEQLPMIGEGIRSFSFADPLYGWMATGLGWEDTYDYGLLSTLDGGRTWQVVSTENGLSGQIQFISKLVGYRLGWPGTVHGWGELQKSEDAGRSWKTIYKPDDLKEGLLRFQFFGAQNGFISIQGPEIQNNFPNYYEVNLKSTYDGGNTWKVLPRPVMLRDNETLGAFDFINPTIGWLAAYDIQSYAFTQLLKTLDSGITWEIILQADNSGSRQFDFPNNIADLDFLDAQYGCLLGNDGVVYITEDGGLTWKKLTTAPGNLLAIQLLDRAHEFALVGGNFPTQSPGLMSISDAGKTWKQIYPPLAPRFWEQYDQNLAYGVGIAEDPGAVLHSQDGGRTWQHVSSLGSDVIGPHAIHFITPQEGWITAQVSNPDDAPHVLYHTLDGGHTWQVEQEDDTNNQVENWALNSTVGFVDKRLGYSASDGQLWKTEDGGLSFTQLPTKERVPFYLQFVSEQIGWGYREDHIFTTEDGGQTWKPLELGYKVRNAVPTGGRMFSLLPGGSAWVYVRDCSSSSENNAQCRYLLLTSKDFGQNWIAYDLGETYFEEIHFVDPLHGWARGGESGHTAMKGGYVWGTEHVYLTGDGGKSWQMLR